MTLIKCSECNKDISNRAIACPHCGNPNQHELIPPTTFQQEKARSSDKTTLGEATKNLLLQKELGQVGSMANSLTGKTGGAFADILSKISGADLGAEWSAKRMATSEYSVTVVSKSSLKNVVNNARLVLSTIGRILNIDSPPELPVLAAIVKGGFMNMNPAVVVLEFEPLEDQRTSIVISGSAKEGWIKQKTAEKIVVHLITLLDGEAL